MSESLLPHRVLTSLPPSTDILYVTFQKVGKDYFIDIPEAIDGTKAAGHVLKSTL